MLFSIWQWMEVLLLLSIESEFLELMFGCFFGEGGIQNGFVEDDLLVRFFNEPNKTKLGDSSQDMVRLNLNTERSFTVRSYYLKFLHLNYSSL